MLQKITLLLGIAVWAFCSTLTAQQDLPPSADNSKAINLKLSDRTFSPASAPAPVQMNLGDSSAVQVNLNDDSTPVTTNQNKPSSPVQMNLSDGTSSRYPSPRSPTVYSQTVNGLPTPGPASMRRGQQSGISYRLQDSMPNLQANAAEKEAIDKSTRQFPTPDFLDPNQYLPESPAMVEHHFLNPNRFLKAKVASTIPSVPTFPKARPIRQEGDDERYDELFQVAPVDSPSVAGSFCRHCPGVVGRYSRPNRVAGVSCFVCQLYRSPCLSINQALDGSKFFPQSFVFRRHQPRALRQHQALPKPAFGCPFLWLDRFDAIQNCRTGVGNVSSPTITIVPAIAFRAINTDNRSATEDC